MNSSRHYEITGKYKIMFYGKFPLQITGTDFYSLTSVELEMRKIKRLKCLHLQLFVE